VFSGEIEWERLMMVFLKILNERHLLLQLDNSAVNNLLTRHHWDGAIQPGVGDFLMVVDTNIGFNKTNAVVKSSLFYDVDLTNSSKPTSSLEIIHENNAKGVLVCKQWDKIRLQGEADYPITDCYWNYLRVYTSQGTKLLNATPQYIPDGWMINRESVPAKIDTLQDEGLKDVQAFGTLQVVPIGESLSTSFHFALPSLIMKTNANSNWLTYHLKVQKQPGTLAVPITIRVHLPSGSTIHAAPADAIVQSNNILYETNLHTDVDFEIAFGTP
jgi:hypothetical protein